jgi:glycosyltransferase involved in cell wall biosynthesis
VEAARRRGGRVTTLVSEPDTGVYDAFNKGLRRASGEVVAFLGAGDEYADASTVSTLVRVLEEEKVDAVFGDVAIVDASSRRRVLRRYSSRSFAPHRLSFGFMPAHPTLFLRKAVYDRIGGYDASYRIAGDFELCVRAFHGAGISYRYVPRELVRMAHGGLTSGGWRGRWTITRELQRACRQNALPTSLLKLLARIPLKAVELTYRPV